MCAQPLPADVQVLHVSFQKCSLQVNAMQVWVAIVGENSLTEVQKGNTNNDNLGEM